MAERIENQVSNSENAAIIVSVEAIRNLEKQNDIPIESSENSIEAIKEKTSSKQKDSMISNHKLLCRYGYGCTHINDAIHLEKFWHPRCPKLNDEKVKTHFICNECGFATVSISELQMHLKRKTAWSNASLVGCRINCLVDFKEWHEGYVSQFHKSGKHFVEFRAANERRWLTMRKVAFYIIERPIPLLSDSSEFKESNEEDNLAPIEDSWVYCEDISLEYTFAQSVLFKIYGNTLQETGHLTRGHVCLTENDRLQAQKCSSSLLYGELLPRGANKVLGAKRLEAFKGEVLFDLGMGTGKILVQAFLQFRNLRYVYGVELSEARYKIAEEALIKLVKLLGIQDYSIQMSPGKFIIVSETVHVSRAGSDTIVKEERLLHFECGNMFHVKNIHLADIIMMETDISHELYPQLAQLIERMKCSSRLLTYMDLRKLWPVGCSPFKQLDINRLLSDRYPTSWSVQRGHHFYLWRKIQLVEEVGASWRSLSFSAIERASSKPAKSPNANANANANGNSETAEVNNEKESEKCIPFSFRFFSSKTTQRKAVTGGQSPSQSDRSVIPLNSDGTRAKASGAMISNDPKRAADAETLANPSPEKPNALTPLKNNRERASASSQLSADAASLGSIRIIGSEDIQSLRASAEYSLDSSCHRLQASLSLNSPQMSHHTVESPRSERSSCSPRSPRSAFSHNSSISNSSDQAANWDDDTASLPFPRHKLLDLDTARDTNSAAGPDCFLSIDAEEARKLRESAFIEQSPRKRSDTGEDSSEHETELQGSPVSPPRGGATHNNATIINEEFRDDSDDDSEFTARRRCSIS